VYTITFVLIAATLSVRANNDWGYNWGQDNVYSSWGYDGDTDSGDGYSGQSGSLSFNNAYRIDVGSSGQANPLDLNITLGDQVTFYVNGSYSVVQGSNCQTVSSPYFSYDGSNGAGNSSTTFLYTGTFKYYIQDMKSNKCLNQTGTIMVGMSGSNVTPPNNGNVNSGGSSNGGSGGSGSGSGGSSSGASGGGSTSSNPNSGGQASGGSNNGQGTALNNSSLLNGTNHTNSTANGRLVAGVAAITVPMAVLLLEL